MLSFLKQATQLQFLWVLGYCNFIYNPADVLAIKLLKWVLCPQILLLSRTPNPEYPQGVSLQFNPLPFGGSL